LPIIQGQLWQIISRRRSDGGGQELKLNRERRQGEWPREGLAKILADSDGVNVETGTRSFRFNQRGETTEMREIMGHTKGEKRRTSEKSKGDPQVDDLP